MVNRLHHRNSSASSSTTSVDGERLQFKFSGLQALQVPKGWDKLSLSLISVETGKIIAKTGRALAQNGNCQWMENLLEYIWVPHDDASKRIDQFLYKLLVSVGSGRSGNLGEITVNLSGCLNSESSISIAEPLKNCTYGTILQVEIQCLTPRANLRNDRWTDTDSFTEDANTSDDLDAKADVSDGCRITKNAESSMSSNFMYTSQEGGPGSKDRSFSAGRSRSSFDSMDDSFGREGFSPHRNSSEVANDLIARQDSIGSSNSAQYSSYNVYDSPRLSQRQDSGKHLLGQRQESGKHMLNQRQDSGKVSIPISPLRTFASSTEFILEAEGTTVEELKAEAIRWERNARKLKVDLDFSKRESRGQTIKLQNATMEVLALQTECDGLKQEIDCLKVLHDESEVKEQAADSRKLQAQDHINTELEEEIKFQRDLYDNLSLQFNKTQESNLELVSVLQELEETIEKQRLEIESLIPLKDKIKELEGDCNELTHENIDLTYKLKELNNDLSTCVNSIEDSEVIKLEGQIQQLKEEAKKRELDRIDAGYLQNHCNDLESKCVELEVNIQGFKDKACYLDGELDKYRAKAKQQENEVAALKQLLKLQQEEKHENLLTGEGLTESTLKELKSNVQDPGNKLLAKISEIEVLKSDCLLKDKKIERLETQVSDLKLLKKQLMGGLKAMQTESTIIYECLYKVKSDMEVINGAKESQTAANKILEKKVLELESCNKELELHLAELEVENLHLSERISGLEPQLRYLTDARESSRLEIQHSEMRVVTLEAEIKKLEEETETSKVDMRQKCEDMQSRWLEAQEECEYLKKANPKLQTTAENLIEECSQLQKSNRELKQQRLDLYNRCTDLEAELRGSQHNHSKLSENLKDLEDRFSLMINEIANKEKVFDSELEALHLRNEEYTEKVIMAENLFNQMYSEKMVEIENLQQEVAHLNTQIHASQDERDSMASEAVHEMHVLRADKTKLEKEIEEVTQKFRLSEKKLETIEVEYEEKIHNLTVEIAASKKNHDVLTTNLEKFMGLLENARSNEEKLRISVSELDGNLKQCEYERVQLTEEISNLTSQLQKIPLLQDEIVALKKSFNDVKYENERLEASLKLITGDYKEIKEEKTSLLHRTLSMQKAVNELEDHKHSKVVLEEQVMRLQGDLTAREALCAQDAELKNELGRLKRSNNQLQWKINRLQEEKDECMKNSQVLEDKLEKIKDLKADEIEISTNNSAKSFRSDSMSSLHSEDVEVSTDETTIDAASRIQSLENELAKALEANDMYKAQMYSFRSEGQVHELKVPLEVDGKTINKEHEKDSSLLETELKELQERYLHMSLKYAEVEAQREDLVSKLKAVKPGKSWFS